MADVTIKSIGIDVKANCENAIKSLNRLKSTIESLSKLGDNSGFQTLCDKLTMIASLDFSKAESNLSKIATSLKEVGKSKASVKNMAGAIEKMADSASEASEKMAKLQDIFRNKPISQNGFDPKRIRKGSNLVPLGGYANVAPFGNTSLFKSPPTYMGERIGKGGLPGFVRGISQGKNTYWDVPYTDVLSKVKKGTEAKSYLGLNPGPIFNSEAVRSWLSQKYNGADTHEFLKKLKESYQRTKATSSENSFEFGKGQFKPFDEKEAKTARSNLMSMTTEWFNNYTATKKASDGMNYFLRTIKRFAIYKSLTVLIKGFNRSLQNLAKYSKEANSVLSEYKSLGTYLGNSLASAVIPWLQLLLPLATKLTNVIANLANAFNILGAAINGNSTYTKAKKYTEDFAESLSGGKTTGFDQINQLSKADDYESMFETVTVEAKDVIKAIGTAVLGISIAIKAIAITHLPSIIDSVLKLKNSSNSIKGAWTTIKEVVSTTDFGIAASKIASAAASLAMAAAVMAPFAIWGDKMSEGTEKFSTWLDGIFNKVRTFFNDNLPSFMRINLDGILEKLKDIKDWVLDFFQLGSDTFYDLFHGNFKKFGVDILNYFVYLAQIALDLASWVINIFVRMFNSFLDIWWNPIAEVIKDITGKDLTFRVAEFKWEIPYLTLDDNGKMTFDSGDNELTAAVKEQNQYMKEFIGKSSTINVTTIENAASRNNRRLATVRD